MASMVAGANDYTTSSLNPQPPAALSRSRKYSGFSHLFKNAGITENERLIDCMSKVILHLST